MTVEEYEKQFVQILSKEKNDPPYDNLDYLNYVRLNQTRINRWTKKAKLSNQLVESIMRIKEKQHWILITEPWCGDAANSHVFIKKLAELNSNITLTVQNRDAVDSEIDNYLTNGGKSIPILVVRSANGQDLFDWGPRPKPAQDLAMEQKATGTLYDEASKIKIQKWYNKDKGNELQKEILQLIKTKVGGRSKVMI